jgi:hypothetical protein
MAGGGFFGGGFFGGGGGGFSLPGSNPTTCQASCMPGQTQQCVSDKECSKGDTCQQPPNPFAGFGGMAGGFPGFPGFGGGDGGMGFPGFPGFGGGGATDGGDGGNNNPFNSPNVCSPALPDAGIGSVSTIHAADSGRTVDAGHPDATTEAGTIIDGGTADSPSPAEGAAD